jgi:hypothetical protein
VLFSLDCKKCNEKVMCGPEALIYNKARCKNCNTLIEKVSPDVEKSLRIECVKIHTIIMFLDLDYELNTELISDDNDDNLLDNVTTVNDYINFIKVKLPQLSEEDIFSILKKHIFKEFRSKILKSADEIKPDTTLIDLI